MKKIKYSLVQSGFETVDGAYFGQVISNGTTDLSKISGKMCEERPALDEMEASLITRTLSAEIRMEVGEEFYRVNAGEISFEPAISGSFPSMDAPAGPDNRLYVNIIASDSLKSQIGAITPFRDSADAVKVKIDNIEDLTSHRQQIFGVREFLVTGSNISASCEGEGLSLLNGDGTVAATITVMEEDGMGQRIVAKLDTAVETGMYILQLKTHGYATPDAELGAYTKNVRVVVPPAPTMVVNGATSCSTPWTIHGASTPGMFHMTGENIVFTDAEDEGVWFTYTDDSGETVVKHATPDKVHQSTTPGAAPYVFDRDFVGGDGSPDHKYTGTLKIASRAGVPGSLLQVFEHECAWDVD